MAFSLSPDGDELCVCETITGPVGFNSGVLPVDDVLDLVYEFGDLIRLTADRRLPTANGFGRITIAFRAAEGCVYLFGIVAGRALPSRAALAGASVYAAGFALAGELEDARPDERLGRIYFFSSAINSASNTKCITAVLKRSGVQLANPSLRSSISS